MEGVDHGAFELIADDAFPHDLAEVAVQAGHERAGAGLGDDDALLFELAVGLGDGVGVDRQLLGQLAALLRSAQRRVRSIEYAAS